MRRQTVLTKGNVSCVPCFVSGKQVVEILISYKESRLHKQLLQTLL